MRLLRALAGAVLLAGLAAAHEPSVQSGRYVAGYNCCTFGLAEGDATAQVVVLDALDAAGARAGAQVAFHGPDHDPLQPGLQFCGDSGRVALVPGLDHVHVFLLSPADHFALCGTQAGPGATAGTVELRLDQP